MLDKKINLQLFAEGAPGDNAQPATDSAVPQDGQTVEPAKSVDEQLEALFNGANMTDNAPAAQDTAQAQDTPPAQDAVQTQDAPPAQDGTPQNLEQSLPENFKSVADLVKSYKNVQGELTRKSQALVDTTKAVEAIKAELQELRQSQPAAQPPEQDEFAGLDPEEFLERFYADPVGVMTKLAEKIAESKVKPIEGKLDPIVQVTTQQQNLERWKEATSNFAEENPDITEFIDGMKEYIEVNKLQDSTEPEKVLKNAYYYAKGLKYAPNPDPATLLNDPAFLSKHILTNPAIKEAILKSHMQEIKNTPAPPVITGSSSGMGVVAPPPERPKNIEEAGNMFESMLKGNFSR